MSTVKLFTLLEEILNALRGKCVQKEFFNENALLRCLTRTLVVCVNAVELDNLDLCL